MLGWLAPSSCIPIVMCMKNKEFLKIVQKIIPVLYG
jgi:hypothetical protein